MFSQLMEFAQGKIVLALEGGYNLDSIAKSSLACVQVLLEDKQIQGPPEAYPFESTWRVIQAVRKRLCTYWPSLADELSWKLINQKTPTPVEHPSFCLPFQLFIVHQRAFPCQIGFRKTSLFLATTS
jgi:histone deacetylase 6